MQIPENLHASLSEIHTLLNLLTACSMQDKGHLN